MGNEAFSATPEVELSNEQAQQAEQLQVRFGISWEEGQQQVEAGKYKGTLADMLLDPKCPVGPGVQDAFEQGKLEDRASEAVQEKLDACKAFFPEFKANVGERFIAINAKKKEPTEELKIVEKSETEISKIAPDKSVDIDIKNPIEFPKSKQDTTVIEAITPKSIVENPATQINQELIDAEFDELKLENSPEEALIIKEIEAQIVEFAEQASETETETVEFILDKELITEIPEPADMLDINMDPIELPTVQLNDEIESDILAEVDSEIDTEEQFKQAALLWSEEWTDEPYNEYQTESEQIEEMPTALIEILPITPEEMVEKLETLPEIRLEEAVAIMEMVIQTVKRVEQGEEVGQIDLELVTAGLEQLVERFLTCLEIEHDETHVFTLVQAILDGSIELSFDNFIALQDDGTHERKYISAWIMAILNQPIVTKKTDHSFIGKYVLSLVSMNKLQLSYS